MHGWRSGPGLLWAVSLATDPQVEAEASVRGLAEELRLEKDVQRLLLHLLGGWQTGWRAR